MTNIIKANLAVFALVTATGVYAADTGTQPVRPVEFTVGTEFYNENYREYSSDDNSFRGLSNGERLMQQKSNLWSLTGGVKYHFNNRHSAKLEGRYSRGKSDYTGRLMDPSTGTIGSFGEYKFTNSPRRVYDLRASYEYTHPINERLSITAGAGLGHRVLRDLNTRASETTEGHRDRKQQTTYAQISTGMNIALPAQFEITPRISYNHMLRGRQYSYPSGQSVEMKQSGGQGIEIEVPVSKKLTNRSKVSVTPFYRGWRVKRSDDAIHYSSIYNTYLASYEPKNYTHEAGMKLQYSF